MASNKIILASQSPRRRQLLAEWGYDFDVVVPSSDAECGICSRETAPELVARLAWQKAKSVADRTVAGLILGCDTVAECAGRILGKPVDRDHAREMLTSLRGRRHQVLSGICLWRRPENEVMVEVDVTRLGMSPFSDDQLEAYLDSDAWLGKAGAFGYQDGLDWVHIEQGSETNVVGLPMELLANMLARANRSMRS